MHSVSFVFDGNVFTITFHRCRLARAVPGVPFDRARAAYSIDIVAPQVRNLSVSKGLKRISGRTSGLVGLWSCGLVILHPALAFLVECTAGQARQCKSHGVCLFDRIWNPPSMALADFPQRAWIAGAELVGGLGLLRANGEGRTGIATCMTTAAAPCVLQKESRTRIHFWKSCARSFSIAIAERTYCWQGSYNVSRIPV